MAVGCFDVPRGADLFTAACVAVVYRGKWHNARFGSGPKGRVYAAIGGGWPKREPVLIFERLRAGTWKHRTTISTGQTQEGSAFKNVVVTIEAAGDAGPAGSAHRRGEAAAAGTASGSSTRGNMRAC